MAKPSKQQVDNRPAEPDPATIERLPMGNQQIEAYVAKYKNVDLLRLRTEAMKRIEAVTGNALLCYVTQTTFLPADLPGMFISIGDDDIDGFDSLIDSVKSQAQNRNVDILFVSNGGSAEAAERIVRLLRDNFDQIRFILPANAYSAATMMSLAADRVLMTDTAALGPIDPQINGIPARAILRGFEELEKRLKEEGPEALSAYIHLLNGYSLHLLEICRSAEELSKELVKTWLSKYMLKCEASDPRVETIVRHFANYDVHKSHSRSIGYNQAKELGLNVEKLERGTQLSNLVRSLNDQYVFFLQRTDFYKVYENAHGTTWGRRVTLISPAQPSQK